MKNKILLIGGKGLIGSDLYKNLLIKNFDINICTRNDNFSSFKDNFDVIIHAANSSKKYEASKDSSKDYKESVLKTSKIVDYFNKSKIVLISTISSRIENNIYGKHRKICEDIVMNSGKENLIFRLPVIFSKNNQRGIIYDIIKSKRLYIDENSIINPVFVDQFSIFFLKKFIEFNGIIEFGSLQDIKIKEFISIFKSKSICDGNILNLTSLKDERDLPDIKIFLDKIKNLFSQKKKFN